MTGSRHEPLACAADAERAAWILRYGQPEDPSSIGTLDDAEARARTTRENHEHFAEKARAAHERLRSATPTNRGARRREAIEADAAAAVAMRARDDAEGELAAARRAEGVT